MNTETRREFVKRSMMVGAALALPVACQPGKKESGPNARHLEQLGKKLTGRMVLPADASYETARKVRSWNPTTDKRPAAIVQCANSDDVIHCIEFARNNDLRIAVRGGGHSNVGWGTCDDGLVIDTSLIKGASVDADRGTMRIGAGSLVIEAVAAASPYGLTPVMAECATVGIGGLTLGGGLSWLSGKYGATCDNLISADVVTADGRSLVASADRNPGLFWAIRGGGGNFGIATSFEYQLQPVSQVVAGGLAYRLEDAPRMLKFFRDFMAEAPDELQGGAWILRNEETYLSLILCFCGDPAMGDEIYRPLRTFAKPVQDTVQTRAFLDTFNMDPDLGGIPMKYYASNGIYLESLMDEAVEVALEQVARAPDSGAALGMLHYMHGAVCRADPESTAFELRQAGALQGVIGGGWNDPAKANRWLDWKDNAWTAMRPYSSDRRYANFAGPEDKLPADAAYGKNYARLVEVKKKFDPGNIFRLNQNVPV